MWETVPKRRAELRSSSSVIRHSTSVRRQHSTDCSPALISVFQWFRPLEGIIGALTWKSAEAFWRIHSTLLTYTTCEQRICLCATMEVWEI